MSRMPSAVKFAAWPKLDRQRWHDALHGDPLAERSTGGGAANWRPATRQIVEQGYGLWLGWLQCRGELDPMQGSASRATIDRLQAYLADMEAAGLADHTRATRLQGLGDALRVMDPGIASGVISRASARTRSGAKRSRPLLHRFRPPADVLAFGLRLMAQAQTTTMVNDVRRAIMFRDGLLIALWTCRPLRIANLAGIHIGKNLFRVGSGFRLRFSEVETKGIHHYECAWPPNLAAPLRQYLETYRPALCRANISPGDDLWVSQFGRGMPKGSVAQIIKMRTRAEFGQAMNSHLMRYIVATRVAENDPTNVYDVAAILGHTSLETSERHYILAGTFKAAERVQKAIIAKTLRSRA